MVWNVVFTFADREPVGRGGGGGSGGGVGLFEKERPEVNQSSCVRQQVDTVSVLQQRTSYNRYISCCGRLLFVFACVCRRLSSATVLRFQLIGQHFDKPRIFPLLSMASSSGRCFEKVSSHSSTESVQLVRIYTLPFFSFLLYIFLSFLLFFFASLLLCFLPSFLASFFLVRANPVSLTNN